MLTDKKVKLHVDKLTPGDSDFDRNLVMIVPGVVFTGLLVVHPPFAAAFGLYLGVYMLTCPPKNELCHFWVTSTFVEWQGVYLGENGPVK